MDDFVKVKDVPHLSREQHSQAIVNTDTTAYERAIRKAKAAQAQRDELREASREINTLKCEMHEIKSLLQQLVSKQ